MFSIELNCTKNCNLNCSYCFEKGNFDNKIFNNVEQFKQFIHKCLNNKDFVDIFGYINIGFWGGEPTLALDTVYSIVKEFINNDKVNFFMYSNGYAMPDGFLQLLKNIKTAHSVNKFSCQISYDGKVLQDLHRVDIDNEKTSDVVLSNINKLIDLGVPVRVKSTINPCDFDKLYEAFLDVISIGASNYCPSINYHHTRGGDLTVLRDNLLLIAKYQLKNNINKFRWFEESNSFCSAGYSLVAVDLNGDILPCHGCLYVEDKTELVIANITDVGVVEKLLKNSMYFKSFFDKKAEKCKTCSNKFCTKCNVVKYYISKKQSFKERWIDFDNQPDMCAYHDVINIVSRAFNKVRSK